LQASLETVQEFKVESATTLPNMETGRGRQSSTSRNRGQCYHGGLFEYLRNDTMDARKTSSDGFHKVAAALEPVRRLAGRPLVKESCSSSATMKASGKAPGFRW